MIFITHYINTVSFTCKEEKVWRDECVKAEQLTRDQLMMTPENSKRSTNWHDISGTTVLCLVKPDESCRSPVSVRCQVLFHKTRAMCVTKGTANKSVCFFFFCAYAWYEAGCAAWHEQVSPITLSNKPFSQLPVTNLCNCIFSWTHTHNFKSSYNMWCDGRTESALCKFNLDRTCRNAKQ